MQRKTVAHITIGCAIIIAVLSGIWYFYPPAPGPSGPQDEMTVGLMADESSALVFIAEEKGYFSAEGLNLTVRSYPNGAAAIRGLEDGETNLTLSSEFPLAADIAGGRDILIAGAVDKYYGTDLVARRDRGIATPADLPGKTIGIAKNSIGEFYLGRFLDLHGIRKENVSLVDILPDKVAAGLTGNGSIDAAVTTPLNSYRLMSQPQNRYIAFPIMSGQATFKVVAGNRGWVSGNPRAVARFLNAIRDASRFAAADPEGARAIVVTRTNSSEDYIRSIWPEHQYGLSLDQSLILAMEDETRWMMRNNLTTATAVPDFVDSVDTRGMETADPGAVAIIGRSDRP